LFTAIEGEKDEVIKMTLLQIGRIVTKVTGREAGRRAVIVKLLDRNYALITGAGISDVRRRRVNINHIEPMDVVVDIKSEAEDKAVADAINSNSDAKNLLESKVQF
jgi:large subunit ribosomal protein L14e